MKTRAKSSDNKMHPFHILHCGLRAAANALRRGPLLNTIQTCCIDAIACCANNYAIDVFVDMMLLTNDNRILLKFLQEDKCHSTNGY